MNHTAKIIEVVGTSDEGVEDAIEGAIRQAGETLDHLQWFQVMETRGAIEADQKIRYQVLLKIAFGLVNKA